MTWQRYHVEVVSKVTAAMWLFGIVALVGFAASDGGWTVGEIAYLGACALVFTYMAFVYMWFCGIWLREDGAVRVVNPFRVHRLTAADIRDLEVKRGFGTPHVVVVLRTGKSIPIRGFRVPTEPRKSWRSEKTRAVIDSVNLRVGLLGSGSAPEPVQKTKASWR